MSTSIHKKRLVILNDNLFQVTKDVEIMLAEGVEVKCVLFFDNSEEKVVIKDKMLKAKWEKLGVELIHIDSKNLAETLNLLYQDEDNVFLLDIDLNINDKYSYNKKAHVLWAIHTVNNENKHRIFFYCTNLDLAEAKSINMYFPGKVLEFHYPNLNYEYPEVLIRYNEEFCKVFGI